MESGGLQREHDDGSLTHVAGSVGGHHVRSADVCPTRIEAIKSARALTTDDGVIPPQVLLGQARVAPLRVTVQAMAGFDTASTPWPRLAARSPG
jgi:hypothetical protein